MRPDRQRQGRRLVYFNPRTPCGVRLKYNCTRLGVTVFQSTHPLRGATTPIRHLQQYVLISIHAPLAGCDAPSHALATHSSHFNPRTPCGVRRLPQGSRIGTNQISIHAPLAGCDPYRKKDGDRMTISIHAPLAGCDSRRRCSMTSRCISIHAPLAGCDQAKSL